MRHCPIIASRGKEGKKFTPSVLDNDSPKKKNFYALRASGSKSDDDEDIGKFLYFFL